MVTVSQLYFMPVSLPYLLRGMEGRYADLAQDKHVILLWPKQSITF